MRGGNPMKLKDVLEKIRRADKITVFRKEYMLYCGDANQGRFCLAKEMGCEVESFHPELLDGLHIYLKGGGTA